MPINKSNKSVWIQDTSVYMLNQNIKNKPEIYRAKNYLETASAINAGIVKDVNAVASAGACGIAQAALEFEGENFEDFKSHAAKAAKVLKSTKLDLKELTNAVNFVLKNMFKDSSIANSKMNAFEAATDYLNKQKI